LSFEQAERTPDPEKRKQLLGFVVVGAGPTGVEVAGAIAELRRNVLASDFRTFDPREASVHLVEAGPHLLSTFAEPLGESAKHQLEQLGVDVHLGAKVTGIDATSVLLGDVRLPCSVAVWAAGVRTAPLTATLGVKRDASGRVEVETDCSVPGHREAFVVGDAMRMLGHDGHPLPGVSQTAMQQARFVAKIIIREVTGKKGDRPRFSYYDKGSMATIGRSRAIAEIGRIHLSGFIAWCAWLLVHVWFLIGFRNRIVVMLTWFWSYVTYKRGSRLITGGNALHMRSASVSATRSALEGASDRSSPSRRPAPPAPPT
jgi:NADH dehydrogenase